MQPNESLSQLKALLDAPKKIRAGLQIDELRRMLPEWEIIGMRQQAQEAARLMDEARDEDEGEG